MRYVVRRAPTEDFNEHFNDVQVFHVRRQDAPEHERVVVWWTPKFKRVACGACSGPLKAMLSTCKHANAVKRKVGLSV